MTNKMLLELGFLGHFSLLVPQGSNGDEREGPWKEERRPFTASLALPLLGEVSITLNSFMKNIQSNILTLYIFYFIVIIQPNSTHLLRNLNNVQDS